MSLKQADRLFYFDSPLGTDVLLVASFTGTEAISELFRFDVEFVSDDHNLDIDRILGKRVTLSILQADEETLRPFDCFVSRFRQLRPKGRLARYRAELVPWLWQLTLNDECMAYHQGKTVPELLELTFSRLGLGPPEVQISPRLKADKDRHGKWDYCCQYRESSFAFISRLMEIEGIYYFFRHERGQHAMIITDSAADHKPCPYQSTFRFEHAFGPGYKRGEDRIHEWDWEKLLRPALYTHNEYNPDIPDENLLHETASSVKKRPAPTFEIYDYPGSYEARFDAQHWGRLRMEELEVDHEVITGRSNARSLLPGHKLELTHHPREDQNGQYLVTRVTHSGREGAFLPGADSDEPFYENSFTCIPSRVTYRPSRKTEDPQMLGSQTAFVVGPPGEEIHTDAQGRVKVQFHWDRKGKRNGDTCCWIRVMQPWAGRGYGQIWIPRVGQEVVVDFLEGDPDRPIITGAVYNAKSLPPYKLPDNKTVSGFRTLSTKNGDPLKHYSELRIEDKKGEEVFAMHAERDMEVSVERDSHETIDRDRFLTVKRHQVELVEKNRHETVRGDHNEQIGEDLSATIGKDWRIKAGGDALLETGSDIHLKAGGRIILQAAAGVTFLSANGASFIDLNDSGVVIQGPMTWINCGRSIPEGARPPEPKAPELPVLPGQAIAPSQQESLMKSATPAPLPAMHGDSDGGFQRWPGDAPAKRGSRS